MLHHQVSIQAHLCVRGCGYLRRHKHDNTTVARAMFLPNNRPMRAVLVLLVLTVGCKGSAKEAPKVTTEKGPAVVDPDQPTGLQPIDTTRDKMRQVDQNKPDYDDPNFKPAAGSAAKAKDAKKGDQQDEEWIPAEFKKGQARWKDTGVYVDGKPIGFLQWGELPIGLPVVWKEDKVSARKRPGTNDPGWRIARQRMYRFTDYLTLMGVDLKQIKELHVVGPKLTSTLIVSGKDLLGPQGKDFMFRFGSNTGGKPIPVVNGTIGNGNVPDKASGLLVYIKKAPPTLVRDVGMVMPGEKEANPGVPYFGDPIRGGVRVYVDNKLAGIIKRQDLDVKLAKTDADGTQHYKLADVLKKLGADTSKAVEMWVVREERRAEKLPMAKVNDLSFVASSQAKGGLLLGDEKIKANVLAFHSKALEDKDLPKITPDDE
jgi:hypothetical protein